MLQHQPQTGCRNNAGAYEVAATLGRNIRPSFPLLLQPHLSVAWLIISNSAAMARGTTPGSAGVPIMVCVLPLLVTPYANTVPLMPCTTGSTAGLPTCSNTCSSNSFKCYSIEPATCMASALVSAMNKTSCRPTPFSIELLHPTVPVICNTAPLLELQLLQSMLVLLLAVWAFI
jgi:hypothetical protein